MFEWLFKYPREVFERGELAVGGGLGGWWWIAAFVLVTLGALFARRLSGWPVGRRIVIHGLQFAALAVLLALLAGPVLEVLRIAPGINTVALLVDTSKSMALSADGAGGASRLDAAKRLLADRVRVGEGTQTALYGFDDGVRGAPALAELQATGERSRVVDAALELAAHYDEGALAAIVLVTDGAQNGGDAVDMDALAAAGVPVHALGVGPERIAGDVELQALALPPAAPPNSEVGARLVIRHALDTPAEARLRVLEGESVLAVAALDLDPVAPLVTADVAFSAGVGGVKEIAVEVVGPGRDPLPANNRREALLDVAAVRHRVLYLEGEPRWEYKFIRRAAAEDDTVRLATWLRTTPRKTYRQGVADATDLEQGFPASLEALYEYDLVVLGSLPATALTEQQHAWLETFVAERGGSVLALAGRQALGEGGWDVKPLARALPVTLERRAPHALPGYAGGEYAAQPTPEGLALPFTDIGGDDADTAWATLPMLGDYQRLGRLKPGATTLLQAQGSVRVEPGEQPTVVVTGGSAKPLLVMQPYGFGRSAVLATASTWRWRMRTPPEDRRHSLFWRQLIRHLAGAALPRKHIAVDADYDGMALRVALKDERYAPAADAKVTASITPPDGEAFAAPLALIAGEGAFGGTLSVAAPGVYRVDIATQRPGAAAETVTRLARVGGGDIESFGAARNPVLLARIAEATGGRSWSVDELGGLADAIAFGGAGIRERQSLPLWDAPIFYLLLVLLKCLEWSLRRYWGGI